MMLVLLLFVSSTLVLTLPLPLFAFLVFVSFTILCFSIGCSCNTHELDILVGDDKPIPVLACEELDRTCVDGFLVDFTVVALASNLLSTWQFHFLRPSTFGASCVQYELNLRPGFKGRPLFIGDDIFPMNEDLLLSLFLRLDKSKSFTAVKSNDYPPHFVFMAEKTRIKNETQVF